MFIDEINTIKEHLNMKRQIVVFSLLSILYFALYTAVSILLGMIVSDVATFIGFWLLNLVSTYVYMRFFFQIIAAFREEESVIYFKDCIPMLVLESFLFALTIAFYYCFVCFFNFYAIISIFVYLYVFFCVAFQLFCFYEVYRGNRTLPAITSGAIRHMCVSWKGVLAACSALACGYIILYICSMGLDMLLNILLPHAIILNIALTMNRWMEVGTVALTMVLTGIFDSTMLLFLLFQVLTAIFFSYFYLMWMGWICYLCEKSWN